VLAPSNQLCYDPSPLQIWVGMQLNDIPVLGIIVQWAGQCGKLPHCPPNIFYAENIAEMTRANRSY